MEKFTDLELDLIIQCVRDSYEQLSHVEKENIRAPNECVMSFQKFLNNGVQGLIATRKQVLDNILERLNDAWELANNDVQTEIA